MSDGLSSRCDGKGDWRASIREKIPNVSLKDLETVSREQRRHYFSTSFGPCTSGCLKSEGLPKNFLTILG
uniref:Uncharacterized protein n=1 Tax=Coccidioides posadasii RMSCC 3488 TaxID=454284 RepID=A0A0J6FES5_COCPO|nr:hypothetical protein CPAG_05147 [Coccidioides posadasii RMSCC 3488]